MYSGARFQDVGLERVCTDDGGPDTVGVAGG